MKLLKLKIEFFSKINLVWHKVTRKEHTLWIDANILIQGVLKRMKTS